MVLDTALKDTDKKLAAFSDSIIAEANEDSKRITEALQEQRDSLIKAAEAEIAEETARRTKLRINEINAREGRRVAAQMMENKRAQLQCREDCAAEAFEVAKQRIAFFTTSSEYLPHLKWLLSRAVGVLGYGFSATVYLRGEDMQYADELMKSVSGVSLAFCEGSFKLGGLSLVCRSRGRRIDMTFDSALSDMVGHFSELSGLNIGD